MINFRKFFAVFVVFSFMLQSTIPAFSQSRSSARSSSSRSSARSSSSGSSARSSSSSSRSSARSSSSRTRSSSLASASAVSTATSTVTTAGSSDICKTTYAECMDIQLSGYVKKYSYIEEDEAAITLIEDQMEPLRCMYYDPNRDACRKNASGDYVLSNLERPDWCKDVVEGVSVSSLVDGYQGVYDVIESIVSKVKVQCLMSPPTFEGDTTSKTETSYNSSGDTVTTTITKAEDPITGKFRYTYSTNLSDEPNNPTIVTLPDCEDIKTAYNDDDATKEAGVKIDGDTIKVTCTVENGKDFCTTTRSRSVSRPVQDIDALYFAYNYYCLPTAAKDEDGNPMNFCYYGDSDSGTGSVYASSNSTAFYTEAFRRLEDDELKIINFDKTDLYKDKLAALELDETFMINEDNVEDLFSDLGLSVNSNKATGDYDLFSISVNPPKGAGTISPKSLFEQADKICRGAAALPKTTNSKLTQTEINELAGKVNALTSSSSVCSKMLGEMEAYYLYGVEKACPTVPGKVYNYVYDSETETATCVDASLAAGENDTDAPDPVFRDTGFASAVVSCKNYESALMSVRNEIYGTFTDRMRNYLDDELAKLIRKESMDQQTIADSMFDLKESNSENTIGLMEVNNDVAEAVITAQEQSAEIAVREDALKTELIGRYKDDLKRECMAGMKKLTTNESFFDLYPSLKVYINGNDITSSKTATATEIYCIDDGIVVSSDIYTFVPDLKKFFPNKSEITVSSGNTLQPGLYIVEAAGGGGSGGDNKGITGASGGRGGAGGKVVSEFILPSKVTYSSVVGGGGSSKCGGSGNGGGSSAFSIGGVVGVVAGGGGGGGHPSGFGYRKSGGSGSSGGASGGNVSNVSGGGASGGGGDGVGGGCSGAGSGGWVKLWKYTK